MPVDKSKDEKDWNDLRPWYNDRILDIYISSEKLDKQNDSVSLEGMSEVMPFLTNYGYFSWQHTDFPAGDILGWKVKGDKMLVRTGFHDTEHSKIPLHDLIWEQVKKNGNKGAASIKGFPNVQKRVRGGLTGGSYNRIDDLGLYHVAYVNNPANPDAKVEWLNTMAKGMMEKSAKEVFDVCSVLEKGCGCGDENMDSTEKGYGTQASLAAQTAMRRKPRGSKAQLKEKADVILNRYYDRKLAEIEQLMKDHFPGKAGTGDRFAACMKSGKSRALCAYIGRRAGKIKSAEDLDVVIDEFISKAIDVDAMSVPVKSGVRDGHQSVGALDSPARNSAPVAHSPAGEHGSAMHLGAPDDKNYGSAPMNLGATDDHVANGSPVQAGATDGHMTDGKPQRGDGYDGNVHEKPIYQPLAKSEDSLTLDRVLKSLAGMPAIKVQVGVGTNDGQPIQGIKGGVASAIEKRPDAPTHQRPALRANPAGAPLEYDEAKVQPVSPDQTQVAGQIKNVASPPDGTRGATDGAMPLTVQDKHLPTPAEVSKASSSSSSSSEKKPSASSSSSSSEGKPSSSEMSPGGAVSSEGAPSSSEMGSSEMGEGGISSEGDDGLADVVEELLEILEELMPGTQEAAREVAERAGQLKEELRQSGSGQMDGKTDMDSSATATGTMNPQPQVKSMDPIEKAQADEIASLKAEIETLKKQVSKPVAPPMSKVDETENGPKTGAVDIRKLGTDLANGKISRGDFWKAAGFVRPGESDSRITIEPPVPKNLTPEEIARNMAQVRSS